MVKESMESESTIETDLIVHVDAVKVCRVSSMKSPLSGCCELSTVTIFHVATLSLSFLWNLVVHVVSRCRSSNHSDLRVRAALVKMHPRIDYHRL